MLPLEQQKCGNCLNWKCLAEHPSENEAELGNKGNCRRYPPTRESAPVPMSWWCREWEISPEETQEELKEVEVVEQQDIGTSEELEAGFTIEGEGG